MKYKIVSVYDSVAMGYGRPAFVGSLGSAIRSFQDECRRESVDNEMFKHPSDFRLCSLGEYDDETGEFYTNLPVTLATGSDS